MLFFLISLLVCAFAKGPSVINIAKNLDVKGTVQSPYIIAENMQVTGNLQVDGDMKSTSFTANKITSSEISATFIESPTGTVVIDGDLIIQNTQSTNSPKVQSFLAEETTVNCMDRWSLFSHESFDEISSSGWFFDDSQLEVPMSGCGNSANHFLGGNCVLGAGMRVFKVFKNLPPHKQLRLTARTHFIDGWRGESGFAIIDGEYVWSDSVDGRGINGIDMCGSPKYPEVKFSNPIDVIVSHATSTVKVMFGSTSIDDSLTRPCDMSLGIDDIMLYTL